MEKRKKRILKLIVVSTLATVGGYINMVALLSQFEYSISHLTGNISRLAQSLSQGDYYSFYIFLSIVMAFFLGSMVSGLIIGFDEFKFRRKYGQVLIGMSILLIFATLLLTKEMKLGLYLASFICGMQNGLIFRFEGALVRTTHLTGTVTDLGVMCGSFIKNKEGHKWKILLNLLLIISFIFGGVVGVEVFNLYKIRSFYLASLVYFVMGNIYYFTKLYDLNRIKKGTS